MAHLIAFSHLRWDFVFQRPQHLLTRIAQRHPVIYIEEVLFNARDEGLARCKLYFIPDKYEISISM